MLNPFRRLTRRRDVVAWPPPTPAAPRLDDDSEVDVIVNHEDYLAANPRQCPLCNQTSDVIDTREIWYTEPAKLDDEGVPSAPVMSVPTSILVSFSACRHIARVVLPEVTPC